MSLPAAAANFAWWAANLPSALKFRLALSDPMAVQDALLRGYIRGNAATDFGRRHGFDRIRSIDDFRAAMPIRDYDGLAADIDRVAAGEANVLTAEPVIRLATSSGSTRARKLIPYTRSLQAEFNRAVAPWIADLYRSDPSIACGRAYWSITPVGKTAPPPPDRPPHAPRIGFEEDSAYLGGVRKRLVDAVMAVPSEVRHIRDMAEFRETTMRHLLARAGELRLISVWHPSFLELLLDAADETRGRRDLREVFPNLRLISCWADAHAAAPAGLLSQRFPGVRVQPKGLLSTEAFVTFPFAGQWPLAVRSHFFEFLDENNAGAAAATATASVTRLAHELDIGREYGVVVTTAGGLWRYRLGDRVRVDGFVERTPSLRFVGRDDHVVDRFGEKLSEGFVGAAIRRTLAKTGIDASFAMLAPDPTGGNFRYTLFVEPAAPLPPDLAARLDAALAANPHYAYCRGLGQLAPCGLFAIAGDAYARYARATARAAGSRVGDVKPAALSGRDDWRLVFEGDDRARPAAPADGPNAQTRG